ncbi:MAG: serine hydrolase [Nocardiopsaceae bacterium]|nr:serine hydrolase [Nocardiopsaceae bacterium]
MNVRRALAVLVVGPSLVTACTAAPSLPAEPPATVLECDPGLEDGFRPWGEAGFSGSIAISAEGEFDCLAGYGWADTATETPNTAKTVFSIGSVAKAFTAAAVLGLVDDGELALDDQAGEILPELGGPAAEATIEQLLLHTSGLTGAHGSDHEPLERAAALTAISGLEQEFEPGTDYLYSNAGYTLLALVIDEVTGSYRDHMAAEVLPLPDGEAAGGFWDGDPAAPGPRAVGYDKDGTAAAETGDFHGPHWALSGNGDLAMTVRDLAAWTHALFTGEIVSPEAVETLSSPGFDLGDGGAETPGWMRLDASAYGEPVLVTTGGGGDIGHTTALAWLPDSERVIAIASNTPDVTAEDLLRAVGAALAADEPIPPPEEPAGDVDPDELAKDAGTYELETGDSFVVTADEGGLAVAAHGAGAVAALFPPAGGFTAGDVTDHQDRVLALLAGKTKEGREERELLEADLGPIDAIEPIGTIAEDGELHTYVTLTTGAESTTLWYALDEHGGIAAVHGPAEPPTLQLVPSPSGGYRPADPTGTGPDVTVDFRDGHMTVTGPNGSAKARSTD